MKDLESLLGEPGSLAEPERQELNRRLREDGGAIDALLEQMEIDALLRWHHGAVKAAAPRRRRWVGRWVAALAAAALLIVGLWRTSPPGPLTLGAWTIEPTGTAVFRVTGPTRLRLERGELFVRSNGPATPVVIETPHGEATAAGTEFLVAVHQGDPDMSKPFARVLVLAGVVMLANVRGSVSAGPSEIAWARQDEAPSKLVVRANAEFGIDLYQRLAAAKPGENLFVSPYSIASVLAMASEGARGKTAMELGRVLHLPDSAKRTGDDAQRIPWETAKLRLGLAALNRTFNREETAEQKDLRKKAGVLQEELKATRSKMEAAMGKKEWKTYNEYSRQERKQVDEINALLVKVAAYELSVANGIWGEASYPFHADFVRTVGGDYGAGAVKETDFSGNPEGGRKAINAWAAAQTRDRIQDVLPEGSITDMTRLVLVNAIYFKGEWVTPFIPGDTLKQDFTLADGTKAPHPMMNAHELEPARYGAFNADGSFFETPAMIERGQKEGLYPAAGGFALAELPYRGDAVSMVIIVPGAHDGLAALEKSLTAESLAAWIAKMKSRAAHVAIPKFRTESTLSLKATLQAMGMESAFSSNADFSGMTAAEALAISDVFHKTFVDVNEKGTEAAAVTGMPAVGSEAPIKVPFTPTIRADRPYLYVIRDVKEGTILFMGRFVKP